MVGDRESPERHSQVALTVALDVAKALERADAASRAERGDGRGEVERLARRARTDLRPPLGEQAAQLGQGGGLVPQRHPLLTARAFIAAGCTGVARAGCSDGEWSGHARRSIRRQAARRPGHQQQRTLEHQHEIPGVRERIAARAGDAVGAAGTAGQKLADGTFAVHAQGRRCVQRLPQQRVGRSAGGSTCKQRQQPLHEVAGEVEAAIVEPGPKQRRIRGRPVNTEHHGRAHGLAMRAAPYAQTARQHLRLVVLLGRCVALADNALSIVERQPVRLEASRRMLPNARDRALRLLVTGVETGAAVPWRHEWRGDVAVDEEFD